MKKITKHLKKAVLLTAFAVFTGGTISSITMLSSVEEAQAATGNDVVTFARTLIGRPYVFGSTGPNSFDCSGLVQYVFKQYGTYFPNDSIGIYNNPTKYGTVVGYGNLSNAKPGDVISWNGHIAIYSGNGNMVHAETAPSKAVAERKVSALSDGKNRNGVVYRASDYKVIRVNGITDSPVPTPSSNWTNSVNSVTTDTLGVKGRVSFSSKKHFSKAGFQIWDSDGNLMKNFSENANWNSSYMDIYYNDVRSEIGVTLKPGTVYTYQYYAVADGQTHYSPKYTKQTNWPGVQNIGEDFYGMIMNESWNPLRVEPNDNIVLGRERNGEWSRLIWHFKRNSDGSYTITSVGDGKAFEVAGADDLDRANVRTWPSNGSNAQKWFIYVVDNKYVFRPACSQTRVLDVQGYSTAEGANIMIYHHHNTSNERFSVYKIQDYTSYSINTEKSEIKTGQSTGITINDTKYAYNYKLHIVKPDGSEKVVDNGEKNTYTFSETTPGTYKVYAEVKGPINTARGSASDRYCTIKVQSNDTRTGVYNVNGTWKYLKNGQHDTSFTGVAKSSKGNWIFVRNGVYDTYFTGVAKSTKGNWIYVNSGRYDAGFTGVAKSTKGNWIFVRNGRYDAGFTGVAKSTKGNWIYVKNGRYDTSFTGVAKSTKGNRLYIVKGRWQNTYTGKYQNYKIKNGYVV